MVSLEKFEKDYENKGYNLKKPLYCMVGHLLAYVNYKLEDKGYSVKIVNKKELVMSKYVDYGCTCSEKVLEQYLKEGYLDFISNIDKEEGTYELGEYIE